jgi:hypothetical protein
MSNEPIDYLFQQFNTIRDMYRDTLIMENIRPENTKNIFTYQNQVRIGEKRSPMSAKYFNSCTQYLAMFKSRSYHFLFNDCSIGRFHYEFDVNFKLSSYNLLWFPCPFSNGFLDEVKDSEFHLFEFLDTIEEIDNFKYEDFSFRSPIRIDYDANYEGSKADFHPTSHIHFQHTDTRARNNGIFCLYKFFNFIIENCYPEFNYKFHEEENNITEEMMNNSAHWLRVKKTINAELGRKIYTSYTF